MAGGTSAIHPGGSIAHVPPRPMGMDIYRTVLISYTVSIWAISDDNCCYSRLLRRISHVVTVRIFAHGQSVTVFTFAHGAVFTNDTCLFPQVELVAPFEARILDALPRSFGLTESRGADLPIPFS